MKQQSNKKQLARESAAECIALMGGPIEAARKLDAPSYQAVQSWRNCGIPARFCRRASELTGVPLERLRPDDWHLIWPELAHKAVEQEVA